MKTEVLEIMAWLIIWTQMAKNMLLGPRPQRQDIF